MICAPQSPFMQLQGPRMATHNAPIVACRMVPAAEVPVPNSIQLDCTQDDAALDPSGAGMAAEQRSD